MLTIDNLCQLYEQRVPKISNKRDGFLEIYLHL